MSERLDNRAKKNADPEKGEEAGGNGEHVPATGETGGEAGREIRVRARPADKPTDNPRRTQFAFDLIEQDGDDLRDLPLIERKRRLRKLIGRAKRRSIRFVEHLTGDGPTVFEHVCRMGLEGIVSKRTDAPYRSGPSKTWLKGEEPGECSGAPGARGGMALDPPMVIRCMNSAAST